MAADGKGLVETIGALTGQTPTAARVKALRLGLLSKGGRQTKLGKSALLVVEAPFRH